MENLTEKLNVFSELVLRDAAQKRDELIQAVETERNERLTQKENEFLQRAYDEIQGTIAEAKKTSNSQVLQAELDARPTPAPEVTPTPEAGQGQMSPRAGRE